MYLDGLGVVSNPKKAIGLIQSACDKNEPLACAILGNAYWSSEDYDTVPRDIEKTVALLKKSCDAGGLEGCFSLSIFYQVGSKIPKDRPLGKQLFDAAMKDYEKRCDSREALACFNYAATFEVGGGLYQKIDLVKSKELYKSAAALYGEECEAGSTYGCISKAVIEELFSPEEAANTYQKICDTTPGIACFNLAEKYRLGAGVPQNKILASSLWERARPSMEDDCHSGDLSTCMVLGFAYQTGLLPKQDKTKTTQYYDQTCLGGFFPMCDSAASQHLSTSLFGLGSNVPRARELLLFGCTNGNGESCRALGRSYQEDKPTSPTAAQESYEKAINIYQYGCDWMMPFDCIALGDMYLAGEGGTNQEMATKIFTKVVENLSEYCSYNTGEDCHALAGLYLDGKGTPTDVSKSIELYQANCDAEYIESCAALGDIYWNQKEGVPYEPEKAKALYRKACEETNSSGCYQLCDMGSASACAKIE